MEKKKEMEIKESTKTVTCVKTTYEIKSYCCGSLRSVICGEDLAFYGHLLLFEDGKFWLLDGDGDCAKQIKYCPFCGSKLS